jgi:CBS domain-containing protein
MAKVSEVMTSNVIALPFSASIASAAKRMRDANVGIVVVHEVQEPGTIYGVVTDRDLVVRAVAEDRDPGRTRLAEVSSRSLSTLSPEDDVDRAVDLMRAKAIRRIPVVDDGQVVGIVSLGDLALARDRESVLGAISASPPNH